MTSALAQIVANRGVTKRARVGGLLVHTTGSGIVDKARRLGLDPEVFAVDFYMTAAAYPNYLIAHDGSIYSFCDEDRWSAHAAWSAEERALYASTEAGGDWWVRRWIDTLSGRTASQACKPSFYLDWTHRWSFAGLRGQPFISPLGLIRVIGGDKSPNEPHVGVEMLDAKPFTAAQYASLAALFRDVCARWHLLDPADIDPATLPQPWLCGHSDVSPMRRWRRAAKDKGAVPSIGFGWDPLPTQIDWARLGREIVGA